MTGGTYTVNVAPGTEGQNSGCFAISEFNGNIDAIQHVRNCWCGRKTTLPLSNSTQDNTDFRSMWGCRQQLLLDIIAAARRPPLVCPGPAPSVGRASHARPPDGVPDIFVAVLGIGARPAARRVPGSAEASLYLIQVLAEGVAPA